jgi:DegV family protein with EDD domain
MSSPASKRQVAVVADSTANLPPALVAEHDITVVPIYLNWGGRSYRDGVDITPEEVYQRLRVDEELPHSAAPSAHDFLQTYQRVSSKAGAIVSVHLPEQLSATIKVARLAAEMVSDTVAVRVVNAGTAAMAAGFVALAAARAASQGWDLEAVVEAALAVRAKVMLYVKLGTLEYLYRSGRMGKAASLVGTALQIKPIVTLSNSVVEAVAKPRTDERALRLLLDEMERHVGDHPTHVAVMHADTPEDLERLRRLVEARFNCVELLTTTFTPVMGITAGPGLLGLAFYTED